MMRHTGGLAVGATSTRSSACSWARRNASSTATIPACEPSASTRRTSRTLILSLILVVLSMISSPPRERRASRPEIRDQPRPLRGSGRRRRSQLQAAAGDQAADSRRELGQGHRAQILSAAPPHRHGPPFLLAAAHHQHVWHLLQLRLADLVAALLVAQIA